MEVLPPLVEQVQEPLCFWNGDTNPANFLSDGHRLTGFVDFAHASWHDPHYGLARFTVYQWVQLDRPLLFQRYRECHRLSERDFALRSAVHCLWMLQTSVPGEPVDDAYRGRILAQLDADLRLLNT
ncbi:MAG: phosphotransferase [Chloroflexi bacterium]|nr:phosphotransferase [Chloroflexota bacterium]